MYWRKWSLRQRGSHPTTSATVATPPENVTQTWTQLNNLCTFLHSIGHRDLASTKEVFIGLAHHAEICKNMADGEPRYYHLQTEMETIFAQLQDCLSQNVSLATTPSCEHIYRSITWELEEIQETVTQLEHDKSLPAPEQPEWREILRRYERLEGHLRQLLLNVDSVRWRANHLIMGDHMNNLPLVNSARYYSSTRKPILGSNCSRVVGDIERWIHELDTVYWMNGMAGTGKTTIAYHLCEKMENNLRLAASFFCSRSLPECRDAALIIPSITSQLAQFSHPYRCTLARALEEDPNTYSRQLDQQFDTLISKPLYEVREALPMRPVVVIDALDECVNKQVVRELVRVLFALPPEFPIKFVLSSRPEPQIRDQLAEHDRPQGERSGIALHKLDMWRVEWDILVYLRTKLSQTGLSKSQITALVQRAGGWFNYAVAMAQYIGEDDSIHQTPNSRADAILQASGPTDTVMFQQIDELYTITLQAAFTNSSLTRTEVEDMRQVLNTVVCVPELSVQRIADLLRMDDVRRVHASLRPFWSVLFIKGTVQSVAPLHPSFSEYLFDPTRSQEHYCNATAHHSLLAHRCFDTIRDSRLAFNVCKLESSYLLDAQVADLDRRVKEAITPEMLYACRHWAFHMYSSNDANSLLIRLEEFLTNHLLPWLEIFNLKQNTKEATTIISKAEQWVTQHSSSSEVLHLVKSASRFVAAIAGNPINQSTPHIYVSMLPSLPLSDPVRRYYDLAFLPLAKRQTGGQVYSATFSPDGTRVALGAGNEIQLVDALSGRLLAEPFQGHSWSVMSVDFSPEGARIASGSRDKTIRLWDTQSGKEVSGPLIGHTGHVRAVKFSPSGSTLVSGSNDSTIRVWDVQSGQLKFDPLIGHTDYVKSIAISSDNFRIVSGSKDGTIRVWDLHTGHSLLGPLKGHTDHITSVSLSPNNSRIVSCSADRTIRIWDSESGQTLLGPFIGHDDWVLSVAFTVDGAYVISGSSDCSIRLWDAITGKLVKKLPKTHESHVFSVACSPDGSRFVSGSGDETVCLWNTNPYPIGIKSSMGKTRPGHTKSIHCICVCPTGAYLASGSSDMNICIWNLHERIIVLGPLEGHTGRVNSVCFSPEGSLLVSGSSDGTIRLWDSQTGVAILHPLEEHATEINSVSCSKSSALIASGNSNGTVSIWSLNTGERLLGPLKGHRDSIQSVQFSPDDTRIVTGSVDRTICVWDVQSGDIVLGPLTSYTAGIRSVVFSPDGSSIASSSDDWTIRLWDAQTGKPIRPPLIGHTGRVLSIQFSSDGNQIVSGSDDQTVRIWSVHSGSMILEPLRGHADSVSSVAFLPNGTHVVSASSDMVIRVWDIQPCPSSQDPMSNHSEWEMDKDGWIVDTHDRSKRLTWFNPELRASILSPRTITLLSRGGQVELDFSGARIGESWTELFQPSETPSD